MTVEPSSSSDGPEAPTEADPALDPVVAGRLAPLADTTPPDLWAEAVRRASTAVGSGADRQAGFAPAAVGHRSAGTDTATVEPLRGEDRRRHRSGAVRALAAAAVLVVVAGAVTVAVVQGRQDGQRIETPAAGFSAGVVTGPALSLDHDAPVGAFAVLYPAGLVVVEADGDVVGHYTGEAPGAVYDPARGTVGRLIGAPDGCSWDSGLTFLYCRDAVGPTVEVPGSDGGRQMLASFPPPPAGIDPGATVAGHLVRSFPQPGVERGRPLLLQMSAECESRLALMVDDPISTADSDRGGVIRRLDGASYWSEPPMAGESLALGWSPDGNEAYVWRFNASCGDGLDAPGIYAYRLDGSSRLLVPTPPDVLDVQLITGETPSSGEGAVTPLPPPATTSDSGAAGTTPAAEPFPGWRNWAGPVLADGAGASPTDRELVTAFARRELGMTNPDLELSSTDLDPAVWIATEGNLSVKLQPARSYGAGPISPEERTAWQVVWATSFWPDGEDFLSAQVNDDTGRWTATFRVPTHASTVSASYTVGGRTLEPSETTVLDDGLTTQFRFDLDSEPTDQAALTFSWHDAGGRLVGYQRTTIPPGTFAAG